VDESVLMSFVNSSPNAFSLSAEQIIYLNDIGVPGAVVTAMIQRDQALKVSLATPPALPPAVATTQAPPPDQVAPQPTYTGPPPTEPQPPEEVSDASFYDALAPYGTWVDVDGYGRCWQPTVVVVNAGWQPYFDCGHWVYTDCGWYWMSSYSWGWAPFHYGRWFQHNHLGWCWAPGHVWGPSWVSWRYSQGYCGWAPLAPGVCFTFGVGLTWHGQSVHSSDPCGLDWHHYRFVHWQNFHDHHLPQHALPLDQTSRIFANTTVGTQISAHGGTPVNSGLPASRVAAATHTAVRPVALQQTATARPLTGRTERLDVSHGTLTVYRPTAQPALLPTSTTSASLPMPRTGTTTFSPTAKPSPNPVTTSRPGAGPRADANPTRTGPNSALVFRGANPPGNTGPIPPNSLVLSGGKPGSQTTPTRPAAGTTFSPTAQNNYAAWNNTANPAGRPNWQRSQTPSAAASPVPWLEPQDQNSATRPDSRGQYNANAQANGWSSRNASAPSYSRDSALSQRAQSPTYQAPARTAPAEVPRAAAPPQAYSSPRSYSAPAPASAPSRPAPAAAPSAPAASSSAQSSSGRGGK
jgi:hypothetical protein